MNFSQCGLEEVKSFTSLGEYQKFIKYIKRKIDNSAIVEIPPDFDYSKGQLFGGRWFECIKDCVIWRLLEPDFPFKGCWEIVSEYRYPSTKLVLPTLTSDDYKQFSWAHMWYGQKIGLITHSALVDKAIVALENNQEDENIVLLAGSYPETHKYEIETYATQLAHLGANFGIKKIKEDWSRYAICYWLNNATDFQEVSRQVDQLYSDLDYPDILSPYVSYMPPPRNDSRDIRSRLIEFCDHN